MAATAGAAALAGQMGNLTIRGKKYRYDPNWFGKMRHIGDIGQGLDAQVARYVVDGIPPQQRQIFAVRKVCLTEAKEDEETSIMDDEDKLKALVASLQLHRSVSECPCIVSLHSWTIASIDDELYLLSAMQLCQYDDNNQSLNDLTDDYRPRAAKKVRGLPDALRVHLRLWILEVAEGVAYLHSHRICHNDLHPGNVLVDRDPNNPNVLHMRIVDFGDARQYAQDDPTYDNAKASDIQRIALLYVYGVSGYWNAQENAIPQEVQEQIFPPRAANESAESWAIKHNERCFVFGVLNYPAEKIQAHYIKCWPHFQLTIANAPLLKGQPKWATDLPTGHTFKPGPRTLTLWQRFMEDNGQLMVRDAYIWDEFQNIRMELAQNPPCHVRIVPVLAPMDVACVEDDDDRRYPLVNQQCPSGTLYSERSIAHHVHNGNRAGTDDAVQTRAVTEEMLPAGVSPKALAAFRLTRNATRRGERNLLFSTEVQFCGTRQHWADVQVKKVNESETCFALACNTCKKWAPEHATDLRHLSDIVNFKRGSRAGRVEPWMDMTTFCWDTKVPDQTELGEHLAQQGATWLQPTVLEIRKRGNEQ